MRTLIVGFGNILLSDDGFGIEVIRRLAAAPLLAHVETLDVGIGGMHFVLRLLDGFQNIVVVDALTGRQPPGTLYVFALDAAVLQGRGTEPIDPHLTEPLRAMQLGKRLGMLPETVTMVGCEPQTCELGMDLTAAVQVAVEFFYAEIPEYQQVGERRVNLLCTDMWDDPEAYDATYAHCSEWGERRLVTPGAIVDGELRTTRLTDLNLGAERQRLPSCSGRFRCVSMRWSVTGRGPTTLLTAAWWPILSC